VNLPHGFFSVLHWVWLFVAATIAGALNSVAGGGSFFSFPALLVVGVPPIPANATNTAALWPGTVASTVAYRNELGPDVRRTLWPLVAISFLGAILGAQILLHTPQSTFLRLIPWLLLIATLLFVCSGSITSWVRSRTQRAGGGAHVFSAAGWALQMVISVYIGYFGAGSGILILALLALLGVTNIHAMNGMKTVLVTVSNAVALATFIIARIVVWHFAVLMLAGATIGGYAGAHYAQKMNPQHVRTAVIIVGFALSVYFFIRYH